MRGAKAAFALLYSASRELSNEVTSIPQAHVELLRMPAPASEPKAEFDRDAKPYRHWLYVCWINFC